MQAWTNAVEKIAGDDPKEQLLAFFDVLDVWFNAPDFRGCQFINAAAEFPNPHDPVHAVAGDPSGRHSMKVEHTMKRVERSVLVLVFLLITGSRVLACTVFFAFDGKSALAGSNKDWADPNSQMWFVPATKDTYGIVYFGFGKGKYPKGGVSSRKLKIPKGGITKINPEDLYGLPQGGMNEKGLFFDGAATDVIKAPPARGKKPYDGRLEDLILRKCATVEEALKLLDTYAFNLSQGQWMFADRTGASFVVEAGEVIVRKKGNYQVMTNFLQSKIKPAKITCPRYRLVAKSLADRKDLSVDLNRSLLKATAQKFTVYSTICDLTNGVVYVYHGGDFDRTAKIDLREELAKGKRVIKIESLFRK